MKWAVGVIDKQRVYDQDTGQTVAIADTPENAKIIAAVPQMIDALRAARTYTRANLQALGEYAGTGDVNTLDAIEQALAGVPLVTSGVEVPS